MIIVSLYYYRIFSFFKSETETFQLVLLAWPGAKSRPNCKNEFIYLMLELPMYFLKKSFNYINLILILQRITEVS